MAVNCVRSTNETYTLRWSDKSWWAVFIIDSAKGMMSVQSDFGDYNARWGAPGESFKSFLTSLDDDYLKKNIASRTVQDNDAISKELRDNILEQRREGDLDSEVARNLWDSLKQIEIPPQL